jgi:hypothetical protein
MTVSPYFNFYSANNEQSLYEGFVIESIQAYGFDTYYMPLQMEDYDEVFREATARTFNQAITIETYLKSNLKFGGDGKFASEELGLEIRDQTIFTFSQKRFKEVTGMERPREGDLMYLPLDQKVYEIKFVDHQSIFYQLGRLMTYDLTCELLEYNGEKFATGIPEIDIIATKFAMDGTANNVITDWVDQSPEIQDISDTELDWSEKDPFGNGNTL